MQNRVSIHERPKVVENKKHFGHWEADLVSFRKNSQHMLVARERKTMFAFASRLPTKRAVDTSEILINLMNNLPKKARKTITEAFDGRFDYRLGKPAINQTMKNMLTKHAELLCQTEEIQGDCNTL